MFITSEDIENHIGATTLNKLTGGSEDVKTFAIDFTNDIIEASLKHRYSLPLSSVPTSLKGIALSIATFKLKERTNNVNDRTQAEYDNAVKLLDSFTSGKRVLDIPESTTKPIISKVNKRTRVFSSEILAKY